MATQDPAEVREAVRQILDQPEFDDDRGLLSQIYYYVTHPGEAIEIAWTWVVERLPWSDTGAALFAWFLVATLILITLYVMVRIGRTTRRDSGVDVRMPALLQTQTADELLEQARAHERDGEWKLALRARYGALLAVLAEAGIVQRRAGRTTGEYVREVRKSAPALSDAFSEATTMFEIAWYGRRETGSGDVEAFRAVAESIRPKKAA